jgi:hypothetical protein
MNRFKKKFKELLLKGFFLSMRSTIVLFIVAFFTAIGYWLRLLILHHVLFGHLFFGFIVLTIFTVFGLMVASQCSEKIILFLMNRLLRKGEKQ